jgi:TPP-dependent pyruvate/acetoin dehydrogenase alpha subunit
MHETFNMAQKWSLPVIFYCENNRYSEMTPISRTSSVSEIYLLCQSLRHEQRADRRQRRGSRLRHDQGSRGPGARRRRPHLCRGLTYRLAGSHGRRPGDLSQREEIDMQRQYEPLTQLSNLLLERGVDEAALQAIRAEVEAEVEAAVEFAQNAPWPDLAEAYTDVYKV